MEDLFKNFAHGIALAVEAAAALLVVVGSVEALSRVLTPGFLWKRAHGARREVWASFAGWLILALEFTIAADIIRTAISPTWNDIGQLGAIAAIRTMLNYFLEKDIENYGKPVVVESGSVNKAA